MLTSHNRASHDCATIALRMIMACGVSL